ncbi:MAG: preprotein translocase subunit SecY [Lachnospiraceae bacterium]|nr:preprotein translocase subunit SecY [Lachnospiraceae bacterium]
MFKTLRNAFKIKDIRSRLFYTFIMLIIVRFGCQLPIPGIDSAQVKAFLQESLGDSFSLLNSFTGGSFEQMSIFALNVSPYITSSIMVQLLTIVIPALEEMQQDGAEGRKKMNQITRIITIFLAVVQALSISIGFGRAGALGPNNYNAMTIVTMVICLTAGSSLVMWMGERITEKGIGNGISIILLVNIVSSMPGDFYNLYLMFMKGKTWVQAIEAAVIIVGVVLLTIVLVILLQDGERKVPVQYAKKMQGRRLVGGQSSGIPIKVNTAGVLPVIFASSILQFPSVIINLFGIQTTNPTVQKILMLINSNYWFNKSYPVYTWGVLIYVLLIVFFAYFYTSITFNPLEISNNLKKQGGFIPGIRPGKPTTEYLNKILNYIIIIGAVGLTIVALVPVFFAGMFKANVTFGGTSLIIVVGVVLETIKNVESKMLVRNYNGFLSE